MLHACVGVYKYVYVSVRACVLVFDWRYTGSARFSDILGDCGPLRGTTNAWPMDMIKAGPNIITTTSAIIWYLG